MVTLAQIMVLVLVPTTILVPLQAQVIMMVPLCTLLDITLSKRKKINREMNGEIVSKKISFNHYFHSQTHYTRTLVSPSVASKAKKFPFVAVNRFLFSTLSPFKSSIICPQKWLAIELQDPSSRITQFDFCTRSSFPSSLCGNPIPYTE